MAPHPHPTAHLAHPPASASELRHSFFPLDISPDRSTPFSVDVRLAAFSHCKVAEVQASAHTASMSTHGCNRLAQRYIKVIWQQRGHAHLAQSGREQDLHAGQWTVYEASRPYEVQMMQGAAFTVLLCESGGQDGLLGLAQRAAGRSMCIEGGAAIALSTLRAVRDEAGRLPLQSRGIVVDFVTSLLSREMQLSDGDAAAARRRAQEAVLREAQEYLKRHIGQHDLSPDTIAGALRVSRRTLYHAFELAGETPQALIQRLRLERCRDVLAQAGEAQPSITQLALEFGFTDPAYFSRAFRQRFGCAPSQYRQTARLPAAAAAPHRAAHRSNTGDTLVQAATQANS